MIKLVSLNLWNTNENLINRMKVFNSYLNDAEPAIVCLQEVSMETSSGRPQTCLLREYWKKACHLYSSQGSWQGREEGLVTFSKLPLLSFESFMLTDAVDDMQRRVQVAVIEVKGKRLIVANTHLAFHINNDSGRKMQCKDIVEHLHLISEQFNSSNIVLAGDLNSTPDSGPLKVLLQSNLGLSDPFSQGESRKYDYTFTSKSPYTCKDLWPDRWIDYVLISNSLKVISNRTILNGKDGYDFVSDHMGLEVVIDFMP